MLKKTHKDMLSHFAGSSKHKRKYSDVQVKEMRARKIAGESFDRIAMDYGVSRGCIYNAIQRHFPITKNEKLPNGYIHISEYCDKNNFAYNTVMHHIRTKKLPTMKYQNKIYLHKDTKITNNKFISDEKITQVCKLSNRGLNITTIAKELKLNRATVSYYINLN